MTEDKKQSMSPEEKNRQNNYAIKQLVGWDNKVNLKNVIIKVASLQPNSDNLYYLQVLLPRIADSQIKAIQAVANQIKDKLRGDDVRKRFSITGAEPSWKEGGISFVPLRVERTDSNWDDDSDTQTPKQPDPAFNDYYLIRLKFKPTKMQSRPNLYLPNKQRTDTVPPGMFTQGSIVNTDMNIRPYLFRNKIGLSCLFTGVQHVGTANDSVLQLLQSGQSQRSYEPDFLTDVEVSLDSPEAKKAMSGGFDDEDETIPF